MPPPVEDDWSDSDDDVLDEIETSVTLGVPDGQITSQTDLSDAVVSRLGGLPAFLASREPSYSSSQCKVCSNPMELLAQMWCPFEDSPMDRALYIWGCARAQCQKQEGSIRAWRALRYNAEYAAKLEKKREKEKAQVEAKKEKLQKGPLTNPFSMSAASTAPNPFGLGSHIFGEATPAKQETPSEQDDESADEDGESDDGSSSSEQSLLTAMTSATLEDSPWRQTLSYPPQYLKTFSEYITPEPKPKIPSGAQIIDDDDPKGGKDIGWSEKYENSLDVDHVFERFSNRVKHEPEQCIRPTLWSFPPPKGPMTLHRFLPCPNCQSKRVFECQLMPNTINVLRDGSTDATKIMSDEERRKAVQEALKGVGGNRGMDWGTCMVFSCEKDCCTENGQDAREAWKEEHVLVQWDV
ncbi:programmed cell death protein 2 [Armillaria borealis]|uniref:Programmed cell death protein 2 n=1 Tax=Armillaria borealis TaxID=47425 RepID=A0AA39N0Y0_9AGAR|nr:programmed cell death protein 2 [Armillaria borealis]